MVASLLAVVAVGIVVAAVLLNQERTQTLRNLDRAEGAERERTEQLWNRPNLDGDGAYRIGSPESLFRGRTDGVAQSKDGRTVVVAVSRQGGQVVPGGGTC